MLNQRKSTSNSKNNKDSQNNSSEEEQIKQIINEINRDYRSTFFFKYRGPTKIRKFTRQKSSIASSRLRPNRKYSLNKENRENSLSYQLKNTIAKETLILELRQELKYHIKFNAVYNNLLRRIIKLKEMVKENKDKVEENTNTLKETFKDRFKIIDQYEQTILLLDEEKVDINKTNKDIIKMRNDANLKLIKDFDDVQKKTVEQREKIEKLEKKIKDLEFKKINLDEDLKKQMEKDAKKYEEHIKLYKILVKKYRYYLDEYNSYLKTGDEITKIEVKLNDETNAKNCIIEENLEVDLSEKLIKKSVLLKNINNLKLQIKVMEEIQEEEKEKRKKEQLYKLSGIYKTKNLNERHSKNKLTSALKKHSSYNNIFSKNN